MLILNEKKEAERILKDINSTECKISQVLNLIIRYNVNEKKMNKKDAVSSAIDYAKTCYAGFSSNEWSSYLNKISESASKKPLRDIESIPITQAEVDCIKKLDNKKLCKLAFACLVISKMNFIVYGHNWINISNQELFKLANLNYHGGYINMTLHELYSSEYIKFAKRIDNKSFTYEKIDESGEPVWYVRYIDDLGYWWEYINGSKYSICEECGRLYVPRSPNQKYCYIHSSIYNKPLTCVCIECGREFKIEPGQKKRKRCECCYAERRLKQVRENVRRYKLRNANH